MIIYMEDFIESYYNAFSEMYNISENQLRELHAEDSYFGHPVTPSGSAWDSEMKALYCAVRLSRPKKVLEIGNWKGYSANHILLALEKNNDNATFFMVDIEENLIYNKLHNNKYIRVLKDSIEFLNNCSVLNFDFIAQDGCHLYEHVKKELDIIQQKTIVDVDIWSHDYFVPSPNSDTGFCNVKQAWDETKDNNQIKHFFPLIDSISDCGFVLARIIKNE